MLIISKEHDYYDTAHDGFIDKTIVYQRTPVQTDGYFQSRFGTLTGTKIDIDIPYGNSIRTKEYTEDKEIFMVGFCGKFYLGVHHIKKTFVMGDVLIDRYIYDFDEMIKCLELKPEKRSKFSRKYHWFGNYYNNFVDFYNKYNGVERFDLFLKYKSPILYIGSDRKIILDPDKDNKKLVLNPILKDIEFFKVFDSKTAFDSISTFISNVLTNPEKEAIIPNRVKIESKGFDYKTSFRKESSKPWKK